MQQQPPLILALDLATMTGFAVGRVGEKPRFGTWRLKTSEDEHDRATRNLGCQLRDVFSFQLPDKLVYEAPMASSVMARMGNSNNAAGDLLLMLAGAVGGVCGPYGVRMGKGNVQTVRKFFLGKARPENPKRAVIVRCRELGFNVTDDNAADALALWHWEEAKHLNLI
jgi:hypothetical protein